MPDRNSESPKTELARHLPQDLRSSEAVHALLSDPLSTATAMITAALASGREDVVLAGGRLVQAVLKGRAFTQLGQELDELLKKGKIRKDYADTKYGFQSLVDLMTMIESDVPDEDKLHAAKAMFVAMNSPNAPEGETLLRYQLFRVVLKLSGSQLVLLSSCYMLYKDRGVFSGTNPSAQNWLIAVAKRIGHSVLSLIEQDEAVLMQYGIVTPRLHGDRSGVILENARLSDLGLKICELIESYSGDLPDSNARSR